MKVMTGPRPENRVRSTCSYIWRNKYLYLLMLPGIVLLLVFKYAPMYGILMAFKDFSFRDGILGSPWNDFAHFKRLFASLRLVLQSGIMAGRAAVVLRAL